MAQKKVPLFKKDVIELSAVKLFRAEDEFVVGKHSIRWMNDDFKKIIASVITESNIEKVVLVTLKLARPATTKEIAKSIGKSGAISLAHLSGLLDSQIQSFLVIVLVKGKVWAVYACWFAGYGWSVDAGPVDDPNPWGDESQVLSRKSTRNLVRQ
ncbi:MAG TPA: hypothetical protein VJC06_00115 [Candidatus Paceibacterota bacterium]